MVVYRIDRGCPGLGLLHCVILGVWSTNLGIHLYLLWNGMPVDCSRGNFRGNNESESVSAFTSEAIGFISNNLI